MDGNTGQKLVDEKDKVQRAVRDWKLQRQQQKAKIARKKAIKKADASTKKSAGEIPAANLAKKTVGAECLFKGSDVDLVTQLKNEVERKARLQELRDFRKKVDSATARDKRAGARALSSLKKKLQLIFLM